MVNIRRYPPAEIDAFSLVIKRATSNLNQHKDDTKKKLERALKELDIVPVKEEIK